MLFSFVRISYNKKSRGLLRLVPFIKATLAVVALITLAWLAQVIWRFATLSFLYVFPPCLLVMVFLEVALWIFNKLRDHMTYRNDIYEYKKWIKINHVPCSMISFYLHMYSNQIWWLYLHDNSPCDHVIKGYVTKWLHVISSFPPNSIYISFLKLWHNNIEN